MLCHGANINHARNILTKISHSVLRYSFDVCAVMEYFYSMSQGKHLIFVYNFGKYRLIFTVLSLLDSQVYACYKTFPPHLECVTTSVCET